MQRHFEGFAPPERPAASDLPDDPAPRADLSSELEAALIRELSDRYDWENRLHFRGRLKAPVIGLSESTLRLGQWISTPRRLELSRALVLEHSWLEVMSVLAHEMAHQFVDEVLGVRDETAHGETFRRICAEHGIDARAAGAPIGSPDAVPRTSSLEAERALDRIRKLLALAGSPNQHEAEIAMRKAHELMLRHNIETASTHAAREFEVRHLGDPEKRTTRVESDVVALLSEFFFVKIIRVPVYVPLRGTRGHVYEVAGTRANVEMAAHVHAFLLATAERLWSENRSDGRVRSGRDRLSYQSGVIRGFREKLLLERVELQGTGLVWVGDTQLDGFYHARNPRITSRRRTVSYNGAHAAGREAGRTIVLHKPVAHGPSAGGPRLLR